MNATTEILNDNERFLADFRRKVMSSRTPIGGSIEITHRCNLRCVHCYLGDQDSIRQHRQSELETDELKGVIDQVVAAGTLSLTLTGGDPMVRRDFDEIYEYAVRQGLLITVFCDGILINERRIELFRRLPPREIEISLYGATRQTYESVTQVPGSYQHCLDGIARLRQAGIRYRLKTVLLSLNEHELDAMEQMAEAQGVSFHYDAAVFPCLPHQDNGGQANTAHQPHSVAVAAPTLPSRDRQSPLELRVSPEGVAQADFRTAKRRDNWHKSFDMQKEIDLNGRLYACGAGVTNYHIDPYGQLQPCTLTSRIQHDLRKHDFESGWNGPIAGLSREQPSADYPCNDCEARPICMGCPAMFELESGSPSIRSSYICRTTQERFRRLQQDQEPNKESTP